MAAFARPYVKPAAAPGDRPRRSVIETIITLSLTLGVLLIPFMMWRFHPDIQFTLSDGCFALAAMFALATGRVNLSPLGDMTPWWHMSFLIMLVALGASSLINGDPLRFAITGSQYVFAYLVLPYFLFAGTLAQMRRLAMFLIAGIVAAELASIVLFFVYGSIPQALEWINHNFVSGAGRLGSFLGSANRNAAMISLALPFVLYFARLRLLPWWVCTFAGAVLLLALVLTASVTGFISSLTALIIFALSVYGVRAWKPVALAGSLAVLAVAAGVPMPAAFQQRVLSAVESGDIDQAGTYGGRMQLIQEAIEISDDTHLLGIGADQFRTISEEGAPVHNIILLIWTEGGMFALLGWLLAMGIMALVALRTIRIDRPAAALSLSVALAFFIISNASTHVYARLWVVPVLFAIRFAVDAWENGQKRNAPVRGS